MAHSFPFHISLLPSWTDKRVPFFDTSNICFVGFVFGFVIFLCIWFRICVRFSLLCQYVTFSVWKGKVWIFSSLTVNEKKSTGVDFLDFVISFWGFICRTCAYLCHVVNMVDTFTLATKSTTEKLNGKKSDPKRAHAYRLQRE